MQCDVMSGHGARIEPDRIESTDLEGGLERKFGRRGDRSSLDSFEESMT